jgi:formiminotetrahydrofolate cyclodeaminase
VQLNESIRVLLDEISSDSPAPGGGSVAALAGSLGASCIMMVCNLTIPRKKYQDVREEFEGILDETRTIQKELLNLSKEDMEAFNQVMGAYKSQDGPEKERSIQDAYKNAANVPLETARRCARLLEMAQITTKSGNKNALTDSGVGALMAHSGLRGAIFNVRVNLKYINDEDFCKTMVVEIKDLEKNANDFMAIISDHINGTLE